MRLTAIKEKLCLLVLRLLGVEQATPPVNKPLAEVGIQFHMVGDLSVVDAQGNLK